MTTERDLAKKHVTRSGLPQEVVCRKLCLMRFYKKRRWDWRSAMEFILQSHNGTLESLIVRTRIGCGMKSKH
jgi:hypothetical protein